MKISGVIAEFNPFHNGHKYLIEKTKENTDAIIAVMSGSFVQRGDVAIFDKWTRAKAAVFSGVDLVIELPVVFSSSTAERFAHGAVGLLSSLNVTDEISFGSESGAIEELLSVAEILANETTEISAKMKDFLASGLSFPSAREMAYSDKIPSEFLKNPNNILALEYIKAAKNLKSTVKFNTVKRYAVGHNDNNTEGCFASASSVRNMIINNEDYNSYLPENLKQIYSNASVYNIKKLENVILYLLRSMSASQLAEINDVTEGLENRLINVAKNVDNIGDLVSEVSSKRYTISKINRILTSILLKLDKKIIYSPISYIRVLAFNDKGAEILKTIKKKSELPIITKVADFKDNIPMFKKDILSTDIAAIAASNKKDRISGKDYINSPLYIPSK